MTRLEIKALMYPHDSMQRSLPQYTWHHPAFIKIHLHATGGAASDADLVTGEDGVAAEDVSDGDYRLSLPELPGFVYGLAAPVARGAAALDVPVTVPKGVGDHKLELHILPAGDRWLVPLRLTYARGHDDDKSAAVHGAKVTVTDKGGTRSFTSLVDGSVYGTGPEGEVQVAPEPSGGLAPAQSGFVVRADQVHESIEIEYRPIRARITVRPELDPFGPENAIPGVTFELSRYGQEVPLRQVNQGSQACVFSDLEPGWVTVRIVAPTQYNGSPITLVNQADEVSVGLTADDDVDLSESFQFKYRTGSIHGRVVDSDNNGLDGISLVATSNGLVKSVITDPNGKYTLADLRVGAWAIMLDQSAVQHDGQTLIAEPAEQYVKVQADKDKKVKKFTLASDEHGIRGHVRDDGGNPVPYAIVEIRNQNMRVIDTVVADTQGAYSWQSPGPGMFVVNLLRQDGETVQRQVVTVNSWSTVDLLSASALARPAPGGPGTRPAGGGGTGTDGDGARRIEREAVTDLAAYPVLTEEVSTTGVPAPVAGGPSGGAGAGYGQAVDQAIRDVLGWRPGGDVAGFQAALTGAFQLREVEGHTEWAWQQRGYSVQADMGALTGAQASIYARAKTALDQFLPLLAGLTSLNPALFPEQDREAIRSVVTTELTELVSELALEGGPRIQRVDELFGLLLGDSVGSTNLNPDVVQGQLGILRQRFALTPDWIETVDDERVATNFRIIVEQILALQASWSSDRGLLSVLDSRTSLGTVLIWLSRGLEAVCESVSDLTFALDSVYIDAAQRQVVELSFGAGQPPLLLSDLLDWIVRASHDEGPRLIQDAGRDGVRAFAPVLRRLRGLVGQTIQAVKDPTLPPGLQTPRVTRALQVLHDQLREASRLAGLVHLDQAPVINAAQPSRDELTGLINVTLDGANFRRPASAVLIAEEREDIPDVLARHVKVNSPTSALATFRIPRHGPDAGRLSWQMVFINGDGTQSYPPFPIQIPIQR